MPLLLKIALIGAGLFAFMAAKTGATLKSIEITFKNLRFKGVKNFKSEFLINLELENPTKNIITFNELDAVVSYKNQLIGKIGIYDKVIKVKPLAYTTIKNISFKVSALTIIDKLITIIAKKDYSNINIKGHIKADGFKYRVDETIE